MLKIAGRPPVGHLPQEHGQLISGELGVAEEDPLQPEYRSAEAGGAHVAKGDVGHVEVQQQAVVGHSVHQDLSHLLSKF